MTPSKYLANFRDEDVYTMLYLYHNKDSSLETIERRFSIGPEALLGFLEGRYRGECYDNYKGVEKMLQDSV
ncbi:hypothetical protein [Planococcus sp. ISL-109]|uniref:hypothetical protein n=1 Tax=Planococcus sp. ISL-109 TaxID=2819166 RepID=UPI001BE63AD1|nr:hypothetical protein [Planococcus sp. ISL-109]MBT2583115.1 hypothetical protein [Planococcus sp. ISL-109]